MREGQKVVGIRKLLIFCDCFFEFINRIIEGFPFAVSVSATKPHVNTGAVSQSSNHFVEQQSCVIKVIQLDVSKPEKISDIKVGCRNNRYLQLLSSSLIVFSAEQNLPEHYASGRVLWMSVNYGLR